jgi:threonine dehydrogenase-like Zn-dependent dehydrogenase
MKAKYMEFTDKGVVGLRTEDVETEGLDPWEVVVRSEASLVSAGTELSRLHNVEQNTKYPSRSGYAVIGRVEARGSAVTDFDVGDRVFFAGKHASVQRFRHGQDHQWGRLYPAPEDLPAEDAVFVCLAEIAMTAPCVAPPDLNDWVAVFGLGLVGNLAAQLYQILGARVIGLDPVRERCELAQETGIETVSDVPADEQVAVVMDLTRERGADIAVEAAGQTPVIETCVDAAALFGTVVLLGSARAEHVCNATRAWRQAHLKELTVRSAHQWQFPAADVRSVKKTVAWGFQTMFDLIRAGKLMVRPLRSDLAQPEQAPEMYDRLLSDRSRCWGVVFDWS